MNKIVLYNQNGQKFDVDVVRYFTNNGKNYLIFSLDERDNNDYIQLYLSKVEELDGKYVMSNVTNEREWADFRNAIQRIVSNNKNNLPNVGDLDSSVLNESVVSEFRIFKLKSDIAELLAKQTTKFEPKVEAPAPVVEEKKVENPEMDLQAASAKDTGLSIEEILKQVSDGAKSAREVTKVNLNNKKKKLTIEDLINKQRNAESVKEEATKNVDDDSLDKPAVIEQELKPVVEDNIPDVQTETIDYEAKYKETLEDLHRLESENVRLINELVTAKAKLETIKDILD